MRRCLLAICCSVFLVPFLSAQEGEAVYQKVAPSVLYVTHCILFDSSLVRSPDLWRQIEKKLGKKLLDTWIPVASGSAFALDGHGTLLTNSHVAREVCTDRLRAEISAQWGRQLAIDLSFLFNAYQVDQAVADYKRVLTKGRSAFIAYRGTNFVGEIAVLSCGGVGEPDLAVLKVSGETYPAMGRLVLRDEGDIGKQLAGAAVFSLGYPLGSTMDENFSDRVVTINKGSIVSHNGASLNIVHSAAISHGNSGGPLVDAEGRVVGVNTATDGDARNTYFYAIGSNIVLAYLDGHGFADLAAEQRKAGASAKPASE